MMHLCRTVGPETWTFIDKHIWSVRGVLRKIRSADSLHHFLGPPELENSGKHHCQHIARSVL